MAKALAEVGDKNITVEFKSFELDPTASSEVTSSTPEHFAEKYGLSLVAATGRIEQISRMGRAEGIDFRYSTTHYTNTFDALCLTKFAQAKNHNDTITKLFDAYFTKNLELSNYVVLKKIAVECGLDGKEVEDVLSSKRYAEAIRADELEVARTAVTKDNFVPRPIVERLTVIRLTASRCPSKSIQRAAEFS